MRIKQTIENIDYKDTRDFFKKRAKKFREENPYCVTMYQDNNERLVRERNQKEIEKLKPLLRLNEKSKVLDVACGIGRWADAIQEDIDYYCGIDFSDELIEIARRRNIRKNYSFYVGSITDVKKIMDEKAIGNFDTILLMGILMYVNDDDLVNAFTQIASKCEKNARICVREPIGIADRLTLKDFFSEELEDNYNAIYRTHDEIISFFSKTFFKEGFSIEKEGFLFEQQELNNRKETEQYYFILKR